MATSFANCAYSLPRSAVSVQNVQQQGGMQPPVEVRDSLRLVSPDETGLEAAVAGEEAGGEEVARVTGKRSSPVALHVVGGAVGGSAAARDRNVGAESLREFGGAKERRGTMRRKDVVRPDRPRIRSGAALFSVQTPVSAPEVVEFSHYAGTWRIDASAPDRAINHARRSAQHTPPVATPGSLLTGVGGAAIGTFIVKSLAAMFLMASTFFAGIALVAAL
ncbi:MAG: hypothetical protein PUK40_02635 [Actinomycetaceae bacterium]|nr:hypothetical protein [Arcanobacterium sp.]MDD7504837.1 hypothetical protein [Actinomycetaceae bacterium]MDY6142783.1 hypothetical protein [Arcanobacterium sp.]